MKAILCGSNGNKLWKDFETYFDSKTEGKIERTEAKNLLCNRYPEIQGVTFEQWIGEYIFSKENPIEPGHRSIIYLLYNHWGNILYKSIWSWKSTQSIAKELKKNLQILIKDSTKIYTTNYDTYLDAKHIHGKFILPLQKFSKILKIMPNDSSKFEYPYLFGGNGYEKLNRLNQMQNLNFETYDYSFLFSSDLDLGHLLIYGMSFNPTAFITEEFIKKYPDHESESIFRSIDGHILTRLKTLKDKNKITKISVAYYTPADKVQIEKFFQMAGLIDMTELVHTTDLKMYDI